MNNEDHEIVPGCRVMCYDNLMFIDDKKTPSSTLYKPATVMKRYGKLICQYEGFSLGPYPDLIDVLFDHRPTRISCGHFTDGIKHIC